ncbi:MAG: hypothetical protein C4344_06560 [Acidimicrobiia bacterium]
MRLALETDEFVEGFQRFDEGSVGRVLAALIKSVWPREDPATLRRWLREDPARFERELQHHGGLFRVTG